VRHPAIRNSKSPVSRWQLIVLAVLSLAPVALFAGFGAWSLYESGRWYWIWWTLPVCWGLGSLLWRWWGRAIEIPVPDLDHAHWTPRDQAAWQIVEAEQKRVDEIAAADLTDPQYYTKITQELALKIARHYHPRAQDPLGSLSVVEILAAVDLISEDMEDWFLRFVPGSHLITVSQWRMLSNAPSWWDTAMNAGWVVSIALNPLNIGRFLASKYAMAPLTMQLQQHLLGAFYTLYLRQAGHYLIELNSGRLRGGSKRYRTVMGRLSGEAGPVAEPAAAPAPPEAVTITIAVIGQVKAGKSSLINCLTGSHAAAVDVLPMTQQVRRHRLEWAERSEVLVLLDTPGYSDAGATDQQRRETREAVRQADLVLLVLDVRSPAREADLAALSDLQQWFAQQLQLKPPAIVAVLNKIDGLSPVLEWSPPYDWREPVRPKEKNIAQAAAYAREVFGARIVDVAPTCADLDHDRVYGVDEYLIPAMAQQLPSARAAALVRSLHAEYDRSRVRQVMGQVLEAGKKIKNVVEALRPS
jgi:small GTP-binding protein